VGWRKRRAQRREAKWAEALRRSEEAQAKRAQVEAESARWQAAAAEETQRRALARRASIEAADLAAASTYFRSLAPDGASLDEQLSRVCAVCQPADQFIVREKAGALLKGRLPAGARVFAVSYVRRLTKALDERSLPEQMIVLTSAGVAFKHGGDRGFVTWPEASGRLTRTLLPDHDEPIRMWHSQLGQGLFSSQTAELYYSRASVMPVYWTLVSREQGLL
jgi:hypothetical protein